MAPPPDPDTLANKLFIYTFVGAVVCCVAAVIVAF